MEFCTTDDDGHKIFKYASQLTRLAHREQVNITIDLDDLATYNESLAEAIQLNTRRYVNFFGSVIQEMLPNYKERDVVAKDSLDVFIEHRLLMQGRTRNPMEQGKDANNQFPPELMRRFEVCFKTTNITKALSVREIKAEHIGKLMTVRGIVTRCTEVKPMMIVATYTCDRCGAETYQPVNSMAFLPVTDCPSEDCRVNKAGGRLYLQTRGSKFVKFQEIKIQEHVSVAQIIIFGLVTIESCRAIKSRSVTFLARLRSPVEASRLAQPNPAITFSSPACSCRSNVRASITCKAAYSARPLWKLTESSR